VEGGVDGRPVLMNSICQRQVLCAARRVERRLYRVGGVASVDAVESRSRGVGVAAVCVVAGPGWWAGVARWACAVVELLPKRVPAGTESG
jgi:hypothetical protein